MLEKTNLKRFFSVEASNTGRQKELDLAKGLAVIFMIWQHILGVFEVPHYGGLEDFAVSILGSPFAAPVFMFTMGMGIAYSRKNQASDLFKRGVQLFLMGFALNIFRWMIPEAVQTLIARDGYNPTALHNFLMMDILQFAGLAFMFMAAVKKFKLPAQMVFTVAIDCSLMGQYVYYEFTNVDIAGLIGLLIPTNGNVTFPFVNWIIFVVSGFYFGHLYRYLQNKREFFLTVTPPALIISLSYISYCYTAQKSMFGSEHSFFFMTFIGMVFNLMLVVGWIGLLHLLFERVEGPFITFMSGLSKNINTVYIVQWTIIGTLSTLFTLSLSRFAELALLISILMASYGLSVYWTRKKSRKILNTKATECL